MTKPRAAGVNPITPLPPKPQEQRLQQIVASVDRAMANSPVEAWGVLMRLSGNDRSQVGMTLIDRYLAKPNANLPRAALTVNLLKCRSPMDASADDSAPEQFRTVCRFVGRLDNDILQRLFPSLQSIFATFSREQQWAVLSGRERLLDDLYCVQLSATHHGVYERHF